MIIMLICLSISLVSQSACLQGKNQEYSEETLMHFPATIAVVTTTFIMSLTNQTLSCLHTDSI